jgi:hypothetical protein
VTDQPTVPEFLAPEQVLAAYKDTHIKPVQTYTLYRDEDTGEWCGCALGAVAAVELRRRGEPLHRMTFTAAWNLLGLDAYGGLLNGPAMAYVSGFDCGDRMTVMDNRMDYVQRYPDWYRAGQAVRAMVEASIGGAK